MQYMLNSIDKLCDLLEDDDNRGWCLRTPCLSAVGDLQESRLCSSCHCVALLHSITMAPIRITVRCVDGVRLRTGAEFDKLLGQYGVNSLLDVDGDQSSALSHLLNVERTRWVRRSSCRSRCYHRCLQRGSYTAACGPETARLSCKFRL